MAGHGGFRPGAGRKPLGGKDGPHRVWVRVASGKDCLKLSVLPEQKEYLRRIGVGNISEGFRQVLEAANTLTGKMALLDKVGELVMVHGTEEQSQAFKEALAHIARLQ